MWSGKPLDSTNLEPATMWPAQTEDAAWPASSSTAHEDVSKLWTPTTDFEQYQAKILQELGADDDDKADLT